MVRRIHVVTASFLLACLPWSHAFAQLGGSRAGLEDHPRGIPILPHLDREVAEGFIAIDGCLSMVGSTDGVVRMATSRIAKIEVVLKLNNPACRLSIGGQS